MRHERSKRMHLDIFSLFLAENMLLLFKTHPILAQHFEEFHAFLDVIIKNIHISIDCKDSKKLPNIQTCQGPKIQESDAKYSQP